MHNGTNNKKKDLHMNLLCRNGYCYIYYVCCSAYINCLITDILIAFIKADV